MFQGAATSSVLLLGLLLSSQTRIVHSFLPSWNPPSPSSHSNFCRIPRATPSTRTFASSSSSNDSNALSPLPKGISPFEKSLSKNIDVQSDFRTRAKAAIDAALSSSSSTTTDPLLLLEIEFPPLLGGYSSKSQFDDFDNVQELNANSDWAVQFAPLFSNNGQPNKSGSSFSNGRTWLVFPDLKECELAREEWPGKRYNEATCTTLKAACEFLLPLSNDKNSSNNNSKYSAPWGAALVEGVDRILGSGNKDENTPNAGLLGDASSLTPLVDGDNSPPNLVVFVQPGNGGPVEDWINAETMCTALSKIDGGGDQIPTTAVVINGALDKVRDGYYPALFFPDLAKTAKRFYNNFETVFYLKPITDKGLYGWLYRVYPEPWQVVLQTVETGKNGESYVVDKVVYVSDERPSYSMAISKMIGGATATAA